MAHFNPPAIQDNPTGWGPVSIPEQFKDMPYQPFSKGDRLGKVTGPSVHTCESVKTVHGSLQLCPVHNNVRFLLEFIFKMFQPEF